ncbi:MAG: PQQ-binding-like beta-propeller repeat protein [Planctomycetaceae bacterium]
MTLSTSQAVLHQRTGPWTCRGRSLRVGVLLLLLGVSTLFGLQEGDAVGADWPQFRGPDGQGIASTEPVPTVWSETRNVVWRTPLNGTGHASPVIWKNQIWLATASNDGKSLGAVAIDRTTGKTLHTVVVFQPTDVEEIHSTNSYASPTPVIAEGRLYLDFGTYGAACVDTETAEILWKNTDLKIEHQGGPGSSPRLFRDTLILQRDGADAQYVVALNVDTGKVVWKRPRSAPFRENRITHRAFATPLLIEHDGVPLLISPAADQTHAYNAATGEEIWHVRYTGFSNVPCPIVCGEYVILCTGFFQPRIIAVRQGGRGDVTETHIAWSYAAQVPDTPSPIAVDGQIYMVSNKGILTSLNGETGERIFIKRLGGNYSSSPIFAGGHLYICSEEGVTHVLKPGEKADIVETNKLKGRIMASPIALEGAIYLRTDLALYRIETPPK